MVVPAEGAQQLPTATGRLQTSQWMQNSCNSLMESNTVSQLLKSRQQQKTENCLGAMPSVRGGDEAPQ